MIKGLLYFVTIYGFTVEGTDNAVAGFAITIRVDGLGHLLVGNCIIKEGADLRDNEVVIGANEMNWDGRGMAGEGWQRSLTSKFYIYPYCF